MPLRLLRQGFKAIRANLHPFAAHTLDLEVQVEAAFGFNH
jgi:hypothetical protein